MCQSCFQVLGIMIDDMSQDVLFQKSCLDTLSMCIQEPKLFPTALELLCSHCSSDLDWMDCLCPGSSRMLRFEIGCPVECYQHASNRAGLFTPRWVLGRAAQGSPTAGRDPSYQNWRATSHVLVVWCHMDPYGNFCNKAMTESEHLICITCPK